METSALRKLELFFLPLSHLRPYRDDPVKKRVKGIEPSCPAWEAGVLPLNYTRVEKVNGDRRMVKSQKAAPGTKLLPGDHIVRVCERVVSFWRLPIVPSLP